MESKANLFLCLTYHRFLRIQTNHLSHFLMTARLWPLLKATAEKYGDVSLTQAVFYRAKKMKQHKLYG